MTAPSEGFKHSTPTSTITYYSVEKKKKTIEFIRELLISIILSSVVRYLMKLPWKIKYIESAKAFEAIKRWYFSLKGYAVTTEILFVSTSSYVL